MSDDNILYDTPLEFMNEAIGSDECVAQSVIPIEDGSYVCGCSCDKWQATASSKEEGLRLARQHTGSVRPATSA